MELLSINLVIFLAFAFYIFKVSYYYDYRYIGNVIRFFVFYFILGNIVIAILRYGQIDFYDTLLIFSSIIFILCLIATILFRNYLVNKFGKEERFANSEEVEDIGNLEE